MTKRNFKNLECLVARPESHTGIDMIEQHRTESTIDIDDPEYKGTGISRFEKENEKLSNIMKSGLVAVPQLNTSLSEEVGSKGEDEFEISNGLLNDSYESSTISNDISVEKMTVHTEFRQEKQIRTFSSNILSLPTDSVYQIASFLNAPEWAKFGQTSTHATTICRKYFTRVRMHAFLCAKEVLTAWKHNQHADARELSALYIGAGVPIYPFSLGHSYRTLAWRMGLEARELGKKVPSRAEDISNSENNTFLPLDEFFVDRNENPTENVENKQKATYLEEKCLYYLKKTAEKKSSLTNGRRRTNRSMTDNPVNHELRTLLAAFRSERSERGRRVKIKIHRHLVDQHLLCKPTVNIEQGSVQILPLNLAVDFFNPTSRYGAISEAKADSDTSRISSWTEKQENCGFLGCGTSLPFDSEFSSFLMPSNKSSFNINGADAHSIPHNLKAIEVPHRESELSTLSAFDFSIYSAETGVYSSNDKAEEQHLRRRFDLYQKKLEAFSLKNDNFAFEECMFDLWDEFLPVTENVCFHDGSTVVPRISGLSKFLSQPCPKAFGVIQCEIERIRINSRKKGVNMKSRLFPAYEYRLFIRDRRGESQNEESIPPDEISDCRRDTILMVAKNKGRKQLESAGAIPMTGSVKKGANNFYLFTPAESDVLGHFKSVNSIENENSASNSATMEESTKLFGKKKPTLIGRLQSNFIGTEFQIFQPTLVKFPPEDLSNADTGDINNLSYNSESNNDNKRTNNERQKMINTRPKDGKKNLRKAYSIAKFRKSARNRLRAVANANELNERYMNPFMSEEEDGAITYSANLLGNRPRMMNVCIPRVSDDGVKGIKWKEHLDSVADNVTSENMLSHFKQLQQRANEDENQGVGTTLDDAGNTAQSNYGLLTLQNRAPWWNAELGAFVLNFGGRVSVASVKNFQLCDRQEQDHIILQFGRIKGRHSFTMDFQYPMTAMQAFAVAISSLQSRVSFG